LTKEIQLLDGGLSFLNELPQDENLLFEEESKENPADIFSIVMEKFNLSQAATASCFN